MVIKKGSKTVVSVDRCNEKGYSIVNVERVDRPKLMFDIVCTLTDMQFTIFHASVSSHGPFACQVFVAAYVFCIANIYKQRSTILDSLL